MSANPENVLAQLAIIQAEIIAPETGVAVVTFANTPYSISAADMPLFVNYVGPLNLNTLSGSDDYAREFNETRNYSMVLYHSPIGAGVEGEKIGLLAPWFNLVYAKFASYPKLKALAGTLDARLVSDSGSTAVSFIGQNYFGIRFTLQIISKVRRTLSEGE